MRIDSLRSLTSRQRADFLGSLSGAELEAVLYDWQIWGRPEQIAPRDDQWLTWLILSGRGWGKTKTGAETIIEYVRRGWARRIALVAETAADCRDVLVEGDSGILRCSPPSFRPLYEPSKRRLTWPNGALAYTYNATEPGQLRGPQHDFAWSDELAKWKYAQETWDQLQFGLRLGRRPRQIVTTTPRPIPLLKEMIEDPTVRVTRGRTSDNRANLAASFLAQIEKKYAGTRLGRQELDGDILDDAPGAFWTREMIERAIRKGRDPGADFSRNSGFWQRIVVAIDPSGISGDEDGGDSIGIVVAGLGQNGDGYVIADKSTRGGPAHWGAVAVRAYHEFGADLMVGEQNFGGAMVEHVIRTVEPTISYRQVHASRGKTVRAEPVAALYEQGRVGHIGSMPVLEDEMCLMTSTGFIGRGSPDHADAMVWAMSELFLLSVASAAPQFGTY